MLTLPEKTFLNHLVSQMSGLKNQMQVFSDELETPIEELSGAIVSAEEAHTQLEAAYATVSE